MIWYFLAVYLHIAAAVVWLGQLIYRLAVVEPLARGARRPDETGPVSGIAVDPGRVSWLCLGVTIATGALMLYYQGVTVPALISGRPFLGSHGRMLQAKLLLAAAVVLLQCFGETRRMALDWLRALIGATIVVLSALSIR